jgi:hypothetical protein
MADGGKLYFSVIPDGHKVKFMTTDEMRVGEVSVRENNYVLHFPRIKDEQWEIVIMVSRYSGEIIWEHGRPPFGKLDPKNVHRSGKCEKGENKSQF